MDEIVNKVAKSDLQVLDLAELADQGEKIFFDLKDLLFQEQILKEKDFRDFVNNNDWSKYKDKNVAIGSSVDAIIPAWAYMLITSRMEPFARRIVIGNLDTLENEIFRDKIGRINPEDYIGAKVMIKGCGDVHIPDFAFAEITRILRPVATSIMYGEPCSSVPIYKKGK